METAAFLGHQQERFVFRRREEDHRCKEIKHVLGAKMAELYAQGVQKFYCGPSPGVGFWAAEAVLEWKAKGQCSGITLVSILPFEGCDLNWNEASRRRYHKILGACDEIISASNFTPNPKNVAAVATAYKRRDYLLVEQATHLVAVYDQDRSVRTQVGQSVNYAKSKHKRILYIHPDTAEVSGWT